MINFSESCLFQVVLLLGGGNGEFLSGVYGEDAVGERHVATDVVGGAIGITGRFLDL